MIGLTLSAVFIASFGLILGTYVFLRRHQLARRAIARRRLEAPSAGTGSVKLWRDSTASGIPLLNEWLTKVERTDRLKEDIRSAGLEARPATIVLSALLLAGIGVSVGVTQAGLLVGAIGGVLGFVIPFLYLGTRKKKRLRKFESQLPEAIDMLINGLRAGYSFQAAMELVGEELPDPVGAEFRRFYEEQQLGMDVRSALLSLLDRVPTLDLKMFVTAILIQRETGGNLTEVLTNISHVIRERFRIQGELRTLTSQVRLSSKILGFLPIAVVGMITMLNPTFIEPLFHEPVGRLMLGIAVAAQVVGFTVMWKLAEIEI